jgi:hypothetical protein
VTQVHSNRWLAAPPLAAGEHRVLGEGDAILTAVRGVWLGIATADCLPIVAVDPKAPALAVVHAGWRGTSARVLSEALRGMRETLDADPRRLVVGIGPGAGRCCYEVGEDVARRFDGRAVRRDGARPPRLDLIQANRLQALEAGVPEGRIHALGVCTICHPESCHSFRRDGPSAGRMWLLASLV